jgi:hypothetical protein
MRCSNLLVMIAVVAAWSIANYAPGDAHQAPKTRPPRNIVAQVRVLIRSNAKNTEIVTFADRRQHPVKVVRGKQVTPLPAAARATGELVGFSDRRSKPVRIMRGGPVVATVSIALPTPPAPRRVGGDVQVVSFAGGLARPVTVLRGEPVARIDLDLPAVARSPGFDLFGAARGVDLDRVAFAVDGAESSHGANPLMWRPEFGGPQGPMQVSAAAALDSGGGDRFDLTQNRLLGRAYLARLYRRYGNWPDAVAAYNWGPGNLDAWIAQGRPGDGLPVEVERYRERVLRDGGIVPGPGSLLSPLSRSGW